MTVVMVVAAAALPRRKSNIPRQLPLCLEFASRARRSTSRYSGCSSPRGWCIRRRTIGSWAGRPPLSSPWPSHQSQTTPFQHMTQRCRCSSPWTASRRPSNTQAHQQRARPPGRLPRTPPQWVGTRTHPHRCRVAAAAAEAEAVEAAGSRNRRRRFQRDSMLERR